MPEQPVHPQERLERWIGWYGRLSLVLLGLLVVGVGGARGRFLIPPLALWYWHVARSSSPGWRAVLGVVGAYLAAEAVWFLLGPGGSALIGLAVGVGAAVGTLVWRAPPRARSRNVMK